VPLAGAALTVQVNDAVPVPPRASAAATVTLNVPHLVGQPVITPAEVIDTPGGRPVALSVGATPAFWSGPDVASRNQTGVPTVDARFTEDGAMVPCTSQVNGIEAGSAPAGGVTVTE
jgi:hypothetical protein